MAPPLINQHAGVMSSTVCEFDAVDAATLTPADFAATYRVPGRPVLIRAAWPAADVSRHWELDWLLDRLDAGQESPEYTFRGILTGTDLGEWGPTEDGSYVFEQLKNGSVGGFRPFDDEGVDGAALAGWFRDWWPDTPGEQPTAIATGAPQNAYFMLGWNNSGLSFHGHEEAFNALVLGKKKWMLVDPAKNPNFPDLADKMDWLQRVLPTLSANERPLECEQNPGDVIFVPENWGHAVWNDPDGTGRITAAVSALAPSGQSRANWAEHGEGL